MCTPGRPSAPMPASRAWTCPRCVNIKTWPPISGARGGSLVMIEITPKSNPSVRVAKPHESAHKHVAGTARYGDDIPEPRDLLHVYARPAERTHARITRMDLSAVREYKDVAADLGCSRRKPGHD